VDLSTIDAFRAARLVPMPVVIGENDVSYESSFYRVPKRDLALAAKLVLGCASSTFKAEASYNVSLNVLSSRTTIEEDRF
jgi:hypothetical protein